MIISVYSPLFKGKSLSLICGALKWLVDSEERDKARIEAVLAGKLPASALGDPGISLNGNGKDKGDTPATESTAATTQGIKVCCKLYAYGNKLPGSVIYNTLIKYTT